MTVDGIQNRLCGCFGRIPGVRGHSSSYARQTKFLILGVRDLDKKGTDALRMLRESTF